jgi:hypothetical protein
VERARDLGAGTAGDHGRPALLLISAPSASCCSSSAPTWRT